MKILFLGDLVAKSGREAVIRSLGSLKAETGADFVIVNGENAAHGKGITSAIYSRLIRAGADIVTLGNHAFSKSEILENIDLCPYLVRPANLEPLGQGASFVVRTCGNKRIAAVSVLCEAFMCPVTDSPFAAMEALLPQIDADLIIVDLHGESTGEKIVFARRFAASLTAVIGTHTHVQTADERVIDGCAFISDVGMCGAYDSVLGRDYEEVVSRFLYKKASRYTPARGPAVICGCLIETDDVTNRAVKITRIQKRPVSEN
ncbi:MAG: TIGR00282 family metallophosphoesterase [Erysipelotrichaceae bacterium]|nr:TIGR00282 family metallophosphoesterase [Erysipelotrichaceae bacterium]